MGMITKEQDSVICCRRLTEDLGVGLTVLPSVKILTASHGYHELTLLHRLPHLSGMMMNLLTEPYPKEKDNEFSQKLYWFIKSTTTKRLDYGVLF
jgi:hypothetical protein